MATMMPTASRISTSAAVNETDARMRSGRTRNSAASTQGTFCGIWPKSRSRLLRRPSACVSARPSSHEKNTNASTKKLPTRTNGEKDDRRCRARHANQHEQRQHRDDEGGATLQVLAEALRLAEPAEELHRVPVVFFERQQLPERGLHRRLRGLSMWRRHLASRPSRPYSRRPAYEPAGGPAATISALSPRRFTAFPAECHGSAPRTSRAPRRRAAGASPSCLQDPDRENCRLSSCVPGGAAGGRSPRRSWGRRWLAPFRRTRRKTCTRSCRCARRARAGAGACCSARRLA